VRAEASVGSSAVDDVQAYLRYRAENTALARMQGPSNDEINRRWPRQSQ
jgi:hypothetical protein